MKKTLFGHLREVCIGLPETCVKEVWGAPGFRVKDCMKRSEALPQTVESMGGSHPRPRVQPKATPRAAGEGLVARVMARARLGRSG